MGQGQGLGSGVWGLEFGVRDLGFEVLCLCFVFLDPHDFENVFQIPSGRRVEGFECGVESLGLGRPSRF